MIQKIDKRNQDIKIWIDGFFYQRDEAKVSVFDSVVQGGDAVWEGIRVYKNKVFYLEKHLNRLFESAKSLDFENIPNRKYVKDAIFSTLKENNMKDDTHIRLTLSRGRKSTSGMNPKLNKFGCTLIVLAEFKPPIFGGKDLVLGTSSIRRNSPLSLDSKIHHNNLINNILAKIESNNLGVDDAIMLDFNGYVSETNSMNIFMIKENVVYTPTKDSCLPGITRSIVIHLCQKNNIPVVERNISITEFYNADEVFVTGTMSELTRVIEIDKRKIENQGGLLKKIQHLFLVLTQTEGEVLPF